MTGNANLREGWLSRRRPHAPCRRVSSSEPRREPGLRVHRAPHRRREARALKQSPSSGRQKLDLPIEGPRLFSSPRSAVPERSERATAPSIELFSSGLTGGPFIAPSGRGPAARMDGEVGHGRDALESANATRRIAAAAGDQVDRDEGSEGRLGPRRRDRRPPPAVRAWVRLPSASPSASLRNCARFDSASVIEDVPAPARRRTQAPPDFPVAATSRLALPANRPPCGGGVCLINARRRMRAHERKPTTARLAAGRRARRTSAAAAPIIGGSDFGCCKPGGDPPPTPAGGKQCHRDPVQPARCRLRAGRSKCAATDPHVLLGQRQRPVREEAYPASRGHASAAERVGCVRASNAAG